MNMKKNIYVLLAAVTALFAACSRENIPQTDRPFADGETGLVLNVRSTTPQTRLIPAPAEDALNEYRLEQYYYFFFAVDPSLPANADAVPVSMGKWTAPSGNPTTGTGTEIITADKLASLASTVGTTTTYSGYAYVIANYKNQEITNTWDGIIESESPVFAGMNWGYFQALPLPSTFRDNYNRINTDAELWPAEKMNAKADEGHRFKAQDSFVMASTPVPFTLKKGENGKIDAPLYRLASKITLEIHLAKSYTQLDNGKFKYTWESDPERIQVYLCYAADKGTMDGTPITYIETGENANAGDFFDYRRFAFLSNWTKNDDGDYVFPDGSYTTQEPYRWVYKEDADPDAQPETVDGQTIYYTKDENLKNQLVTGSDNQPVMHDVSHESYKITGTPFYSYPYDFSGNSGHAPYFKVIVEWTAYDAAGTAQIMNEEFFYKITIPEITEFEKNTHYGLRLNLSTLGSEVDDQTIDVSSDTYFVANWSDPLNPDVPDLTAGRYLNVSSLKKDANENPLFEMFSQKIEIPVVSSHPIVVDNLTCTYPIYSDAGGTGQLNRSTTSITGSNYKLTIDGNSSVVIEHQCESKLANMQARDLAPITYTLRIKHEGTAGNTYYRDVTVVQYPPIYIIPKQNYDYSDGGGVTNNSGYVYVNNNNQYSGSDWQVVRGLTGNNKNQYLYLINVSVLDATSTYKIGDPRSMTIDNNWGRTFATVNGRTLSYYYPTEIEGTANIIAPLYRVASSYGVCGDPIDQEDAFARCAAYQEDGYPAGRWRVPTQSEIEFITTMSGKGIIPKLFNTVNDNQNSRYWSAQGAVQISNNGTVSITQSTSGFVRCVYDEWYWGSETVNRTQFTWGDQPR